MADELKPVVYDLFCGLGGWSEAFLAEGYECIGFDNSNDWREALRFQERIGDLSLARPTP